MPIFRVKNSQEKYQVIAKNLQHRNELTGRGLSVSTTASRVSNVCKNIASLKLDSGVFVDVGCGDGSFLVSMAKLFDKLIGILPTSDEVLVVTELVKNEAKSIDIKKGRSNRIPLNDNSVDFLLCNSVLHGVGFDSDLVDESLKEMVRVLKPGGFLYIGEIPELNEMEGRKYGNSIIRYLTYSILNRGLIYFVSQVRQIIYSLFSKHNYILQPVNMFFENKEGFRSRLNKSGLDVLGVFDSESNAIVADSTQVKMRRLDYLCVLDRHSPAVK